LKKQDQLEMTWKTHGGKRPGAGRKRQSARPNVAHRPRPEISKHEPLNLTMRLHRLIKTLRNERAIALVYRCLAAGADRFQGRVIHFSVQRDHIHLVAEAENKESLTRFMKGLSGRIAKRLNKFLNRRGQVISDRYHATALTCPTQVKSAIAYVLNNYRHHAAQRNRRVPTGWVDPCSNGYAFDGWTTTPEVSNRPPFPLPPLPQPRTFLLTVLWWRKAGKIAIDTIPGPR